MEKSKISIKLIKEIFLLSISFIVVLIIFILMLLQTNFAQNYITEYAVKTLSKTFNNEIKIENVRFSIFDGIVIKGIYVEDLQKDTLLYIKELYVYPDDLPTSSSLSFSSVKINELSFNIREDKNNVLNFQFIIDALKSDKKENTESGKFLLTCKNFELKNSSFTRKTYKPEKIKGLNPSDIKITKLNVNVTNFALNQDAKIMAKVNKISLKEQCGLNLRQFSTDKLFLDQKSGIYTVNTKLKTSNSNLAFDKVDLILKSFDDFSDFLNKVKIMSTVKKKSVFSFVDVSFFAPFLENITQSFSISGNIDGTIANMNVADFKLKYKDALDVELTTRLKGLPDINKLKFNVNIKTLKANVKQLQKIKLKGDTSTLFSLPKNLSVLDYITYSGYSYGSIYNFSSKGKVKGKFGKIAIDISGSRDSSKIIDISGKLSAENLAVADIIDNKDIGKLSFKQDFNFSYLNNEKLKLKTEGTIDSVSYKHFKYKNVKLYADMFDFNFDSISVGFNQKNIKARINAIAKLNKEQPEISFLINADTVNLSKLNILPPNEKSHLSFSASGNFKGNNPDNFKGEIKLLKKLHFVKDTIDISLNKFNLTSYIDKIYDNQKLILHSDFVNIEIVKVGTFTDVISAISSFASKVTPLYAGIQTEFEKNNNQSGIDFNIDIKNINYFTKIFVPELYVAPNTLIKGKYLAKNNFFKLDVSSDKIKYQDILANSFYIKKDSTINDRLVLNAGVDLLRINQDVSFQSFDIGADMLNDSIKYNISWDNLNDSANYEGKLKGLLSLHDNKKIIPKIVCDIEKSKIVISGKQWNIQESKITIDTTDIDVSHFVITKDNQQILINGKISEEGSPFILVFFNEFKLSNLNDVPGNDFDLNGQLSGSVQLGQLYASPVIIVKDSITKFEVNKVKLGNMFLNSRWVDDKLFSRLILEKGGTETNKIEGFYFPQSDSISYNMKLTGIPLNMFKLYYRDYIDLRRTKLSGNIDVTGFIKKPQIDGHVSLQQGYLKVKFLNTGYSITSGFGFKITNNKISVIDNGKQNLLSARSTGKAVLNGSITHKNFTNFNFDLDLNVDNFQFLNTHPTDTSMFYGSAYGTGNISVGGDLEDVNIKVDIETNKKTKLYIPLSTSEALDENSDFINFTTDNTDDDAIFDEDYVKEEDNLTTQGFDLLLNLRLTPGAEIQLIMDETTGGVIKAAGRGDLRVAIDNRGEVSMFGDFNVLKGDYLFSLQNIISKHFTIQPPSNIKWQGSPTEASLNLKTVYALRGVPLYNLVVDDNYRGVKSKVNCNIDLTGTILKPNINFGINVPGRDDAITQQIKNLDKNNINKQFLSLLIIGNFQPLPGLSQESIGATPSQAGEVITNQLNRWLSNISNDFDIGVNYQMGNQMTDDELGVALSTQLWDDRISINGNVGVGGKLKDETNQDSKNVVGEAEVDIKLNKSGTTRMKVFNKANDDIIQDKGPYTQGVGFFWRHEFDKLFFWRKEKQQNDTIK